MTAPHVRYHRVYGLSAENDLVEEAPAEIPPAGSVARDVEDLRRRQADLNRRLAAVEFGRTLRDSPPDRCGIYPLTVTRFTCSCEGADEDGMAALLTSRLGNLKVIRNVPFMQKGDMVFAIRSQGLVDRATGRAESVDALFGGGIYWTGTLGETAYDYDLLLFSSGRDRFVGRMSESIDLTRQVGEIDPDLFQAEVAWHLQNESAGPDGRPTLARDLAEYGSVRAMEQVDACYAASRAFGAAAAGGGPDLATLAATAREACVAVPGKRYYQAYDAFLAGIHYDPATGR